MKASGKKTYDLTKGPILSKILLVAVPIMGTQLMQMSYNLADVFWMGRLGSDAVAASGTGGLFMWMAYGLILFGRIGAEIGVSQNLGRSDLNTARTHAQNAFAIAAFFGTLYSLCMIVFRYQLIGFFNFSNEKVAQDARVYLLIASLAMPFDFLYNVAVGIYNASGNSRTPFIISTAGLVGNMILDPILIFTFKMGIVGAVLSTAGFQMISCIWILIMLKKSKNRPFQSFPLLAKPRLSVIKQLLSWSVPTGLESMFFTGMAMITTRFTVAFGESAMAVGRVGGQIESLSWLIGGGFGVAMTSYIGQNFGAKQWDRIRKGFWLAFKVVSGWGVLITLMMFFAGSLLFSVFLTDANEIALGGVYLQILAWCQLPQCYEAIAYSVFKGTGNTVPPSIVSVTCNVCRVVLAYFLSKTSLGLYGIWYSISFTAVARGVWLMIWSLLKARNFPKIAVLE